MDIMTIVLVFLLVSDEGGSDAAPTPDALELPHAAGDAVAEAAVTVTVSRDAVYVDGVRVLLVKTVEDEGGIRLMFPEASVVDGSLPAVQAALVTARGEAASTPGGRVVLQCDRRLPYEVVKLVMHTASLAGFDGFRFVVVKGR